MAQLSWNDSGKRFFEAGVDRGVLYPKGDPGVPWNGLLSISENPVGADAVPYYIDGVKYLMVPGREEFAGTIEAFTYPDEFAECDGTHKMYDGFFVTQQRRKPFDLSYRTGLGNDLEGIEYGYKIHLVYNALVNPSSKTNSTLSDSPDPMKLSWNFTTIPVALASGFWPTAHVILDSSKTEPELMAEIEASLYGTSTSVPTMMSIEDLIAAYLAWHTPLQINEAIDTGLAGLTINGFPDLNGNLDKGLYFRPRLSRLEHEEDDGLYSLEN